MNRPMQGKAMPGRGGRRTGAAAIRRALLRAAGAALLAAPVPCAAQAGAADAAVFVNGEAERYLRVLQVSGAVPLHPWSLRALGPREVERLRPADAAHPWAGRSLLPGAGEGADLLPARVRLVYNSALPEDANDGAVWAGRGVTAAAEFGASFRAGPVSLVLYPVAFVAQNAGFGLLPNGAGGDSALADPREPGRIDAPQRFGMGRYARLDPGQSTLRVDLGGVAAGVSTANQFWGPAVDFPLVLGNHAAGFAHLFAGTSRPVNVGVGRVHGRLLWGALEQSPWAITGNAPRRRFAAGAAAVFTPAVAPGLEVGGTRFFHMGWDGGVPPLGDWLRPFQSILKIALDENPDDDTDGNGSDPDNQLASVFARWVFPRSGFELYGEYAREDHSYDVRDLLVEPDHASAFLLGFRRVWGRGDRALHVLRGEVVNAQETHLDQVRGQNPFYIHTVAVQGHTHRGQVLGSPAVYAGAGSRLAWERYGREGRTTLAWSRRRTAADAPLPAFSVHALEAGVLRFAGPLELAAQASGAWYLGRGGRDLFNLSLEVGATWTPGAAR
jgi:hypothetical protein